MVRCAVHGAAGAGRLAKATGDARYLDYMDREWWITSGLLYDPAAHLYSRDATFLEQARGQRAKAVLVARQRMGDGRRWRAYSHRCLRIIPRATVCCAVPRDGAGGRAFRAATAYGAGTARRRVRIRTPKSPARPFHLRARLGHQRRICSIARPTSQWSERRGRACCSTSMPMDGSAPFRKSARRRTHLAPEEATSTAWARFCWPALRWTGWRAGLTECRCSSRPYASTKLHNSDSNHRFLCANIASLSKFQGPEGDWLCGRFEHPSSYEGEALPCCFPRSNMRCSFWRCCSIAWSLYRFTAIHKHFLLLASYIFYGFWNWSYMPLLFGISLFSGLVAQRIQRSDDAEDAQALADRAAWWSASRRLATTNTQLSYDHDICSVSGAGLRRRRVFSVYSPLLPLGVSFFVFHAISLLGDATAAS